MFLDLNDHVVGEILAYSDIYTVLSFTRLNHRYRSLAFSKQLWIRQIRRLQAEDIIHAISQEQLEACDTSALVDEVKRITYSVIDLLPGGRYCQLFTDGFPLKRMDLCHIPSGRVVKSFQLVEGQVTSFPRIVLVEGQDLAFLLRFCYTGPVLWRDGGYYAATIQRLDLRTGHSEKSQVLIVNWRSNVYTYLYIPGYLPDIVFIPGFICTNFRPCWTRQYNTHRYYLDFYSMDSFSWHPIETLPESHAGAISFTDPRPTESAQFSFGGMSINFMDFEIFRDPLRRGSYKVLQWLEPDWERQRFQRASQRGGPVAALYLHSSPTALLRLHLASLATVVHFLEACLGHCLTRIWMSKDMNGNFCLPSNFLMATHQYITYRHCFDDATKTLEISYYL
ncbi:hypothetical protein C8F01DRAFT_1253360 [Mycena amicta]|nr:hypothetical protein C8F01DRAFT_1253360 [Mycena amicta]